jgi:hypothetical protein
VNSSTAVGDCSPGGCLAKADEHDRTGITWSPTRCIRRPSEGTAASSPRPEYRLSEATRAPSLGVAPCFSAAHLAT